MASNPSKPNASVVQRPSFRNIANNSNRTQTSPPKASSMLRERQSLSASRTSENRENFGTFASIRKRIKSMITENRIAKKNKAVLTKVQNKPANVIKPRIEVLTSTRNTHVQRIIDEINALNYPDGNIPSIRTASEVAVNKELKLHNKAADKKECNFLEVVQRYENIRRKLRFQGMSLELQSDASTSSPCESVKRKCNGSNRASSPSSAKMVIYSNSKNRKNDRKEAKVCQIKRSPKKRKVEKLMVDLFEAPNSSDNTKMQQSSKKMLADSKLSVAMQKQVKKVKKMDVVPSFEFDFIPLAVKHKKPSHQPKKISPKLKEQSEFKPTKSLLAKPTVHVQLKQKPEHLEPEKLKMEDHVERKPNLNLQLQTNIKEEISNSVSQSKTPSPFEFDFTPLVAKSGSQLPDKETKLKLKDEAELKLKKQSPVQQELQSHSPKGKKMNDHVQCPTEPKLEAQIPMGDKRTSKATPHPSSKHSDSEQNPELKSFQKRSRLFSLSPTPERVPQRENSPSVNLFSRTPSPPPVRANTQQPQPTSTSPAPPQAGFRLFSPPAPPSPTASLYPIPIRQQYMLRRTSPSPICF